MSLFFLSFSRRRHQKPQGFAQKQHQTLFLEPRLTPSGLVDMEGETLDVADLHIPGLGDEAEEFDLGFDVSDAEANEVEAGFDEGVEATNLEGDLEGNDTGLVTVLEDDFLLEEELEEIDPEAYLANLDSPVQFESGVFTVGETGEVSIDFLFDGGGYQGELAIFSLEGMEEFDLGSEDFIREAARRALSSTEDGHIVISDRLEGARFDGLTPGESGNWNSGDYQGVKTFQMRPGDRFGVMLVPNGRVEAVADNPGVGGASTPLFSLATANPDDMFATGQIADATGGGKVFVFEDLRVDQGSDRDYNDLIFQVTGAYAETVLLDDVLDAEVDWRDTDMGHQILAYADASLQFNEAAENQPLIGIIDTGFNGSNPDIDYSRVILGRDLVDGDGNPLFQDSEGNEHGTHILGIIGATRDNGIGIDGINDDAPIWLGRAVGSGRWAESLIEFVDAAKESGQPNAVVNLSFDLTQIDPDGNVTTRYEFTPGERQALEYARQNRVLVIASSGNNAGVMSVLGQASQEFDNIITVGSSDYSGDRAEYASYGNGLDLVSFGGTSKEPVTSLIDSGADLELLRESDFPLIPDNLNQEEQEFYYVAKDSVERLRDDLDIKEYLRESQAAISLELENLNNDSEDLNTDLIQNLRNIQSLFKSMEAAWIDLENIEITDTPNSIIPGSVRDFLNSVDKYLADEHDRTAQISDSPNEEITDWLLAAREYFGALKEIETGSDIDNNLSLEDDFGLEIPVDFGVGGMAGTSVATAKVTGAASQVWAANPDLSYLQVKEILKRTAVDLNTPGWNSETGAGLVNLAAAVSLAKATSPQSHTPTPISIPTTWDGEGKFTPSERPASLFSGRIERVGDVAATGWLRVRSGPGLNFAEVTKIPAGSEMTFNDQALGGWVHDFNNYGSSRLWYRLANGIGWMSALYIRNLGSNNQPQIPSGFQVDSQFAEAFQTYQGILGNPTSARYSLGNGVFRQKFEKGYIDWNGVDSTVYQAGEPIGRTGQGLAVPRRYYLHPRKGLSVQNWRTTTVAGIWGRGIRRDLRNGVTSYRNDWVFRVDGPDRGTQSPHLNVNSKHVKGVRNHIRISPRLYGAARPLSRGSAFISRAALPVGIGLSVWNIGSALRRDNWRLGRNSKDAIGEEAGGWAGAAGGAWAGAKIGAGIGLMVGGPAGAVVGGLVGGLVGAVAGSFAGSWAGRSLASRFWR